jgi:L-iditol 2-dehydrogenase
MNDYSLKRPAREVSGTMLAAVYRGNGRVVAERISIPEIQPGEVLIRVETCGICHTDLK